MAELSGNNANQRGQDEHYKKTKKVTVYFYDTSNDVPIRVSSTNPLPISGTLSGGGDGAILDGADSAIKATVKDLTNSNPLTTALVDANGDQITSFGGGTQYTEGDTDASFTGTISLVEGAANAAVTLKQPTQPTDTQPISANALPLPTGAATAANQQTDALTDTELRATPVPVSGTFYQATQPVSYTTTGSGTATGAIRVELPTNGTGTVGLNAGTNAIGKLSANSGVDIGDVDVTSAVSASFDHGSNLDIDTTAEQITTTSFAAKFGVTVKAAVDNTDTVYIGNSDVTAGTTAATDGFPLEPGESITLPVNNPNLLYAIGAAANQKVFWSAV